MPGPATGKNMRCQGKFQGGKVIQQQNRHHDDNEEPSTTKRKRKGSPKEAQIQKEQMKSQKGNNINHSKTKKRAEGFN